MRGMYGLVLALAAGTAAAADDEVLAIRESDVPKLWTLKKGRSTADVFGELGYRAGCASFSYIIESNGKVSSIRVLRAWPDTQFGDMAAQLAKSRSYEPTRGNKNRQAIFTLGLITFTVPGYESEVGTHMKKKVDLDEVARACAVSELKVGG